MTSSTSKQRFQTWLLAASCTLACLAVSGEPDTAMAIGRRRKRNQPSTPPAAARPAPTPRPAAGSPIGYLDVVRPDGLASGWTLDPDVPARSLTIHIYADGPAGQGRIVGAAPANRPRPDVNRATGHPGDHGFVIRLPAWLRDGRRHTLYVYGINLGHGRNAALTGSGMAFTIGGSGTGSPPPPNPGPAAPPPPPPTTGSRGGGTTTTATGPVGKWRRRVLSFTTQRYSGNPFEIPIDATFVHRRSGKRLSVPGYYDGNHTWKIGFMPTEVGRWTYTTASPNGDLAGHSGRIEAVASGHPGLLARDPAHPDKWRYADGQHVVPIGVFVNAMLEDASMAQFTAMADFLRAHNLNLLNFRISENDKAFSNVGAKTMHLGRWRRLEQRLEVLTARGIGVDIMLYTDDSGKPSFRPRSAQERLLIRYAVARLCGFPSVMFNSGIDINEYRDRAWEEWYGRAVQSLDPYGHPVSSRGAPNRSGQPRMATHTYKSTGDRNSRISGMLASYAPGDGVPAANNDNFSEDLANNINGHTPADIRRAAWKATIAGGVAFHVRHNRIFHPAGITEGDRYFHIASLPHELDSEQWLGLVNPFIRDHLGATFASMEPAPALVAGAGGKFALADPARRRILYLLMGRSDSWDGGDGGPVMVKLRSVSGRYRASWFDPRTGRVQAGPTLAGGNNYPLAPPSQDDWLLVLKRL